MEMPVVSQRDGESDCDLPHAKTARNARIKVVLRMMMMVSFDFAAKIHFFISAYYTVLRSSHRLINGSEME